MRVLFGIVGLLVTLAIVGLVVRKQLDSSRQAVPALQTPAASTAPAPTVKEQSQMVQQQYKQAVEGALQQARPVQDDK